MKKTEDKNITQLAVIIIIGIIGIILAYNGDSSYVAIVTAIVGLIAPSPVQKLFGGNGGNGGNGGGN